MRKVSRAVLVCLLWIVGVGAATSGSAGGDCDSELRAMVIKSARQNEAQIRNFDVRFDIVYYTPDANGKLCRHETIHKNHVIREDRKLYTEFTFTKDGYTEKGVQCWDGEVQKLYREDLQSGMIQKDRQVYAIAGPDRYTNLYVNIKDMTMSELLEASDIQNIERCEFRDRDCYLAEFIPVTSNEVSPERSRVYFDIERGFIPLMYEVYRVDVSEIKPMLVSEALEFTEAEEGIYFPTKGVIRGYFERDENGQPKLSSAVVCEVSDVKLNVELGDGVFDFQFPQGAHVWDSITDVSYKAVAPKTRPLQSLVGKELGGLEEFGVKVEGGELEGKRVVVCFWDYEQRPSRHVVGRLGEMAKGLEEGNVKVVLVQAQAGDKERIAAWLKEKGIEFAAGQIEGDAEEVRGRWGVKSLPWMVLTDEKRVVAAEGMGIEELEGRIGGNKER